MEDRLDCKVRTNLAGTPASEAISTGCEDVWIGKIDLGMSEFRTLNGWAQRPDKMLQKGEFGYHQFHPLTGCVDPEPILYPFTLEMKVFCEQKCIRRISDSKMINLPDTVQNCMELKAGKWVLAGLRLHLCYCQSWSTRSHMLMKMLRISKLPRT